MTIINTIKYILLLIVNMLLVMQMGTAFAAESKTIYEQCFISKVKDSKIGYSCTIQKEKYENSKRLIHTNKYSEQQFKRFGFTVKIVQDLNFLEDEQGNPVSFSANIESLGEKIEINGEFVSSNKILINSNMNGVKKTEEINLDKKILFPYAVDKLFKENVLADNVEYSTIEPSSDLRVITVKAEKLGKESLSSDSLPEEYIKYKVNVDFLPNVGNFEWHNYEGKLVKEQSSILNMEQIAVKKDRIFEKNDNFDLLSQSIIPVDAGFSSPSLLDQVSYKIETKNSDLEDMFIADDRQRIIQIKDNTIFLKIKNEHINSDKYKYPVNTKGYLEYLKSGPFIIVKDELIENNARILVGQEKDAYKISKKMEKWVFDTITNKDFSINFANSVAVLKSKQGDCTEHSILLASLLRAAGIPSKVVIGLIYTDKPEKSFVYHMWVNAYIGRWINLDPSFPDESFNPVHIALYESGLNNLSDRTDVVLNILKSLANLKINILNYTGSSSNITDIKISESAKDTKDDKFNIINLLKSPESPVRRISLQNKDAANIIEVETQKKTREDYIRSGFYNFSKGKIAEAKNDFTQASELISYNDDFSDIMLALKVSSLGLFGLADSKLKNLHDSQIWEMPVKNLKKVYYPKIKLSNEEESALAEALSKINFQNDADGAINLILKNKYSSDYANYILAKAYISKNEPKKAIDKLNSAISINSENLNYKLDLARAYMQVNELKKAKKEIDFILKQNISDEKFDEQVKTESFWLKFKLERNNKVRSQYYLARYYSVKGEFKTAADILNKLAAEKYKDPDIYTLLGDIYYHENQFDKAKANYLLAYGYDKSNERAIAGLANIKLTENKYKEALNGYLKAAKINSQSTDLLLNIANCYKLLSQEELSYKYYNQALKLDSNSYKANYNIGIMYSNMGEFEKAKSLFKRALSLNPNHSESWIELARIEISNKNYFLAKAYLSPAVHINQQSPDYYYLMGLIHKNNENFSEAKLSFRKALQIKSDFANALQELQQLN